MVVAGEVGFLLREKLTEFQCQFDGLGFAKTIFWGFGFRKTETNFFFAFCPPAERGLGNECGRAVPRK
jgi:hypothetical protein